MTFDEDDANHRNHILTIIYVSPVKASIYQHNISHYSILRTIEAIENITPLGESVKVDPISDIWISPIPAQ
jgi:phosphatidylinositol-3-phosphatase